MVEEIEAAAAALREEVGTEPLGMERIRNQDPLSRSANSKRSPKRANARLNWRSKLL